jgi:uncharacterized membrane protein YraQ (UPF0718 family)
MWDEMLFGAILRFLQSLVQSGPTIFVGLLVAGVFRWLIGAEGTRRMFGGGGTYRGLFNAWVAGMLLPVCSLGVIPVARELRRAGLSGGTVLAFALTAPLFNPLSVLYGLTLANPIVIFTFAICALVIVMVLGVVWDRLFPGIAEPPAPEVRVAYGFKRIMAVMVAGIRELAGPSLGLIVIGLLGVAILSVLLPAGSLQRAAEHDDPWAPLFMALVAVPAYATPMVAMVQLATMFQHGNSVGAAFALLALGAGTNLGMVAWMIYSYGWRRSVVWFLLLIAVVVGLSYAVDRPLYPHGVEAAGHTHAFDIYCCPFYHSVANPAALVWPTLRERTTPYEVVAMIVLAAMLLGALALRRLDRHWSIEAWLEREPSVVSRFDRVIPGPVLGVVSLVGLVVISIFGCYVYYPSPEEVFEELRLINVEVVASANAQHWDTAAYWIPIYDDWTRKLQVSVFLRGRGLTEYRRMKASILRDRLELLEHEVEDQDPSAARKLAFAVNRAYLRTKTAYLK